MPEAIPAAEASLAELVPAAASRDPKGVAAVCGAQGITYADLDRAVGALGDDLLDRGLQLGSPVAVMAGTGLEFMVMAYAVLRTGAALVPISPAAPVAEVATLLHAAGAEMVLTDAGHEAIAWAAATAFDKRCGAITLDATAKRNRGDRLSLGQLTGAATPAAATAPARHRHRRHPLHQRQHGAAQGRGPQPRGPLPQRPRGRLGDDGADQPRRHARGAAAGPLLRAQRRDERVDPGRRRLELMPRFETAAAWRLIRNRGVTVVTGVPTMYRRLADDPDANRNTDLRLAVVSGAACPRSVARDIRLRMGVHAVERYGMTEASPLTWRVVVDDAPEGDVGWPGWGVHVRVVGAGGRVLKADRPGELEVQAPSMLLRYLQADDDRAAFHDGWLRTGDIGVVRADGGVTLRSRLKEVILRGGYSVAAGEVEQALAAHPLVVEAVVVGVPDAEMGEELAAALVLHPRSTEVPVEEVVAELEGHMKQRLASWKRPRLWRVIDEVPRTPLGKVRRDQVVRLWDAG